MQVVQSKIQSVIWKGDYLLVLDQRLLPFEKKYLELKTYKEVISAIKDMAVRGAPLIGICAGYGMALAALEFKGDPEKIKNAANEIKQSRPTAVNLKWAVDLILSDVRAHLACAQNEIINIILKRAIWIHEDDKVRCQKIGEYGAKIVKKGARILTICNTGALATGGIGTAFGVILTAHNIDPTIKVFASETRPRQQGARLTTFECMENGIDCTLISDTACGYFMQKGEIDLVISGADRIAANGDSANKIGTYQLGVLAHEHNIPFYVAAPLSTFDLRMKSGDEIPIEEREEEEVTKINGKRICADKIKVRNPAFDVTPGKYITGIITEKGILKGQEEIEKVFNAAAIA